MNRIETLLIALALTVGCKSKSKTPTEDKPAVASGSVVATVDAAAAAPASATVTLPAGEPKFGCLGWSPTSKVAACVVGETGAGEEAKYSLAYVGGSEPASKLDAAANATLAKLGVAAFASPAKEIKVAGTSDLGGGASLLWTSKETDKGGDNTAPTTKHEIVVTCANKKTAEIVKSEIEGSTPALWVWMVPDHVVIEVETNIAREGESRSTREAMLLELATCELVPG